MKIGRLLEPFIEDNPFSPFPQTHSTERPDRTVANLVEGNFILPFVFMLAMVPQNILQLYEVIQYIGNTGLLITILYPELLLFIDFFRSWRRRKSVSQHS